MPAPFRRRTCDKEPYLKLDVASPVNLARGSDKTVATDRRHPVITKEITCPDEGNLAPNYVVIQDIFSSIYVDRAIQNVPRNDVPIRTGDKNTTGYAIPTDDAL